MLKRNGAQILRLEVLSQQSIVDNPLNCIVKIAVLIDYEAFG